ncbi:MAG: hypothetical protein QM768_05210 [Agriterribacter sp.]
MVILIRRGTDFPLLSVPCLFHSMHQNGDKIPQKENIIIPDAAKQVFIFWVRFL